ncbi:MAG: manganese efflux pump MntP family protein [Corallococcus sp.]|nr:manganese efflux pump MntP family protein [Corallococcus sp.]MCM1360015.1 manganese efflux pump MntP family protein [Corallococcus sp.]MCM1395572.1 manganese efflux pump MntP family protein [Corallococcus sp.]
MNNVLFVIFTAVCVSIDSFIAGFSLSLNKRKSVTLPMTVAAVTFVMCLIAGVAATLLHGALQQYGSFIGASILICLGIANLLRRNSQTLENVSFFQCFAIGFGVGLDGAAATLSLVLQGMGDALTVSLIVALTHFFTVYLGQHMATKNIPAKHANLFAAATFFVLAAIKLLDI